MNSLQLELTRLIGKKELTFGCMYSGNICIEGELLSDSSIEYKRVGGINPEIINNNTYIWSDGSEYILYSIIGHPATLFDLHRFMNEKRIDWKQDGLYIEEEDGDWDISYDSSKELLKQSEDTLKQIVELVKANSLSNQ